MVDYWRVMVMLMMLLVEYISYVHGILLLFNFIFEILLLIEYIILSFMIFIFYRICKLWV